MLGLKLNHVSKRGHWCLVALYRVASLYDFFAESCQIFIHTLLGCNHKECGSDWQNKAKQSMTHEHICQGGPSLLYEIPKHTESAPTYSNDLEFQTVTKHYALINGSVKLGLHVVIGLSELSFGVIRFWCNIIALQDESLLLYKYLFNGSFSQFLFNCVGVNRPPNIKQRAKSAVYCDEEKEYQYSSRIYKHIPRKRIPGNVTEHYFFIRYNEKQWIVSLL